VTRKPTYDPNDYYDEIVEWLAAGKTLASYARQPGKPSVMRIYTWRSQDQDFAVRFARAREAGFDVMADELEAIAEEPSDHPDDVAHRKLRVWTRLQLLARWSPRYSERSTVQVGGDPAGVPIQIDDAERARRVDSLLAVATARLAAQDAEQQAAKGDP
jgi:hypothetical protein